AQAGTRGAEPWKLVVSAQEGSGNACGDLQDIATLLPRSLNVGFKAPDPLAKLIVVARLEAADHPVDIAGCRRGAEHARSNLQSHIVLRLAPAIADVHAPIEACPGVDRGRWWGRWSEVRRARGPCR